MISCQKPPGIITADANDHNDQRNKQLIHLLRRQFLVQDSACHATADTTQSHHQEPTKLELRNVCPNNGAEQAGDLRDQDDVQAVLCRHLCLHGEEEIQHNQIDGATADAQEAGHNTKQQADHQANCLIGIDNREIPLVIATSMTLFNRYGIDSAHCVDYDIENTAFASHEITLITDAFTSGTSLCSALEQIKNKMNKYPSDVVVGVDRMERSDHSPLSAKHEIENRYGVKIHPIVNADDIIKAIESGVITAGEYFEKLKDYMKRYKGE